jgi:hypothetical protein
LEGGLNFKFSLLAEMDKQKNIDLIALKLSSLKDAKIDSNSMAVSSFFKDRRALGVFLSVERRLGDIQSRYTKHLPADVTLSLIKLQQSIWALELLYTFHNKLFELSSKPSTLAVTSFLPLILKEIESVRLDLLQAPLRALTKEIDLLYSKKQLRFNYPVPM